MNCADTYIKTPTTNPPVYSCNNFYTTNAWTSIGAKLANPEYKIICVKNKRQSRPYFRLKICIGFGSDKENCSELLKMYNNAALKTNKILERYIAGERVRFDAGFDLFVPEEYNVDNKVVHKLDHGVQCSMEKVEFNEGVEVSNPVGYYLYPRSSMGTKTPLSLANSVGIIDSGYRGNIIAAVHSTRNFQCQSEEGKSKSLENSKYKIERFQRLVQLCPPDLSYPIEIVFVDTVEELGDGGDRGKGGFGSTGI